MRRLRRVKILATLGPASSDQDTIAPPVRRRRDVFRINMSHATHDMMRERVATIRGLEKEFGRPIGILVDLQGPKLRRRRVRGRRRRCWRRARTSSSTPSTTPGDAQRVYLPHPEILRALRARPHASSSTTARSACSVVEATPERAVTRSSRSRGEHLQPQGRQPARHGDPGLGHDRRRIARISRRRSTRASTGSRCPSCSAPEDVAEVRKIARGRAAGDGQDREAAGDRAARRDHGGLRRADGGARRSRRRNAAREGAGPAEAHHPRRPPAWQAGGGGDADAGIDDHLAGADPRRGVRRRDRRVRGRGRRDAVGRKRRGPVSRSRRWRR